MTDKSKDIAQTLGLEDQGKSARFRLFAGLGAALLLGAGWYGLHLRDAGDAVRYVTAEVLRADMVVTVTATGTIEPTNLVEISSELSGTLSSVRVDFNDPVEVGTVLATLDTTKLEAQVKIAEASLDAAIARVAVAEAGLENARQKYEAARDLDSQGFTPHQTFLTQRAAFRSAQAELQSARADRALAEANLDLAQAELGKACICSPIKGVVLDRAVDPGQIVAASLAAPVLFTVAEDLSQMDLQVAIDEADIGRVGLGNRASFTVDAYDDRRFPAEISELRFSPETIDGVVTYKAVLSIDNSDMALRPGMTATADITVAEIADALTVPNAALRYAPPREVVPGEEEEERSGLLGMLIPDRNDADLEGDDKTLWILEEGQAREIAVRAGASDGRVTQILEGEIGPGTRVITDQTGG